MVLDLADSYELESRDAAIHDGNAFSSVDVRSVDGASGDATPSDAQGRRDASAPDADSKKQRYVIVGYPLPPAKSGDSASSRLAFADMLCATYAEENGPDVLRGRNWKAWLSTASMPAVDRIEQGALEWIRHDGTTVFASTAAIRSNIFLAPIETSGQDIWTGNATRNCGNWTDSGAEALAVYGVSSSTTNDWNFAGYRLCNAKLSFYCFEDRL
jgi:hypothetical protein